MSSDNESELDNVIDDILKDTNNGSQLGSTKISLNHKSSAEMPKNKPFSASNTIESSNSRRLDKNATETTVNPNQAKSVRFQNEPPSDSVFSKLAPSNLLNSFFLTPDEKDNKTPPEDAKANQITSKTPGSDNRNERNINTSSKKATNEEWLGIGKRQDSSESKPKMDNVFMANYDFGLPFDNEEPITPASKGMDTGKAITSFSSDGTIVDKSQIPSEKSETQGKKSSGQTSLLDAMFDTRSINPPSQPPQTSKNVPKQSPYIVPQSQTRPDDSPPSSLDLQIPRQKLRPSTSLVDALPFLLGKQKQPSNRGDSLSPDESGEIGAIRTSQSANNAQSGTTRTVKKKSVSGGKTISGGVTLHLPSHLVNEDELKAMSSSLKTLYQNQLQLLEQSYREQIEFFAAQSKRKEELLKDDLTRMQEDYEQRINKLKADAENSQFPQLNVELTNISSHLEKVSSQLECIQTFSQESSKAATNTPTKEELAKIAAEIEAHVLKALALFEMNLTTKLDNVGDHGSKIGNVENVVGQITSKLDDISNNNQRSAEHILNSQTQLKTLLVDSVVGSISKAMDHSRREESKKKGKSNLQLKELRKDLRRMVSELDGKNDGVQRSHLNIELEQRCINQSVRDINTFLKVLLDHKESSPIQKGQLSQTAQTSVQNEMEIKLLRQERKALSSSIAEVNVERRKLTEEKLYLEREKMEFERERVRVRDAETLSNVRLVEADSLKREAEQTLRHQEAKLMAEAESKRRSLSKEKIKLKERVYELDQALALKEQKMFAEKSELVREKEFIEKMREQSLCPGCLKGTSNQSLVPTSSQNLHNFNPFGTRSSGDGGPTLDYGLATKISQILTPHEKAYFLHESKYLEELMRRVHSANNA